MVCNGMPASSGGCSRKQGQCELCTTAQCTHTGTEGLWRQVFWFPWSLGFVVRMCLECIIKHVHQGWALSRVLKMVQGQTLSGCSWLGMQTPSILGSMCSHKGWSQGIPGTPNRPENRSMEGITPGSLSLSPPAALPRLPFSYLWPEPSCLPLLAECCCCLHSLMSVLPHPSAMVLHLAVTEMGRIFIDAAERGEHSSDRQIKGGKQAWVYLLLAKPRSLCI